MKFAIVDMSQIRQYERMDANFHIAVTEHKLVIEKLRRRYDKKQMVELLQDIPQELFYALKPIISGCNAKISKRSVLDAIRRHPFVAGALICDVLDIQSKKYNQLQNDIRFNIGTLTKLKEWLA